MSILEQEARQIKERLNDLRTGIRDRLNTVLERENLDRVSLLRELLQIPAVTKSLCDELLNHPSLDPLQDVNLMWIIMESHSTSPSSVTEGTRLLERFFKLKMRSMIKPTDYHKTIVDYLQWQNNTVRCFVDQYKLRPRTNALEAMERLWNWNYRAKEGMFFGGAARPLHLRTVNDFAAIMSIDYDRLCPLFKENRSALADALNQLLRQESKLYWPDYEIFPCHGSKMIFDSCLQHFFFKDRDNTWFINSSASDYIPFVNSAREIFAGKFIGSDMSCPDQHHTAQILHDLQKHCKDICAKQSQATEPTIIILLTSKNRFGQRIDVDSIHSHLARCFRNVVTIVDACQDGEAFSNVDIIIYTKRFTTTGAMGLVNQTFLAKNPLLYTKLTASASFPIGILAQMYINLYMINKNFVHGVNELVNSAWWKHCSCPLRSELHSTFDYPPMAQFVVEHEKDPIRYTFTEDPTGTILLITAKDNGQSILPKLWALLKSQGHSLDCFVMDNSYLESKQALCSDTIRGLINGGFINELRKIEALSSDYLAWPLIPFSVTSTDNLPIEQLLAHFDACYNYHCCLRISVGRCAYPGKLKRLADHIEHIFEAEELNVPDAVLGKHASQWPS